MITNTLQMSASAFEAGTGWTIKPEGACHGEVCVPLGGGPFDTTATAARLRMAVVADEKNALWAVGPASLGDRSLATVIAPELVLDDLNGQSFRLSSLRGKKVVIVSWAPY
jgi:hypothetical protein